MIPSADAIAVENLIGLFADARKPVVQTKLTENGELAGSPNLFCLRFYGQCERGKLIDTADLHLGKQPH